MTGSRVATADYLGQLADPAYLPKPPFLYEEFQESSGYNNVLPKMRLFKSAQDLMAKTRGFWNYFALRQLEKDYRGIYRALAQADDRNPYVEAVDANLRQIDALQQA